MKTPLTLAASLALTLSLLSSAGCGKKEPTASPMPTPTKEPPKALAISALDLTKEYHANAEATNKKYQDKLLEVTGEVASLDQTEHKGEISLKGFKPEDEVGLSIRCDLAAAALPRALGALSRGQEVKVKGTYFPSKVKALAYLTGADFTEITPSTLVKTSSKDLAKKFTEAAEEARKEFVDKETLVWGKVLDLKKEGEMHVVRLEGFGEMSVVGRSTREEAWAGLKKGEEARLRGVCSAFSTEKEIQIDGAFAVPEK
ncbi:MAG: hypothetical protein U0793_25990 [Gemmataceae bacterium]